MGWDRSKVLRCIGSGAIILIAFGAAFGLDTKLEAWQSALPSAPQPLPPSQTSLALDANHRERDFSINVDVDFKADGSSQVTVHQAVKLSPLDPLVAMLQDGQVEQDQAYFDSAFAVGLSTTMPTTETLVTSDYTATAVTATDSYVAQSDFPNLSFEIYWAPQLSGSDTSTITVSVTGGLIAGIGGKQVPPHNSNSVTLAMSGHSTSSGVDISLASFKAPPYAVSVVQGSGSSQTIFIFLTGSPGLSGTDVWTVEAFWTMAIPLLAVLLLRKRPEHRLASVNLPGLAAGAATAWLSAIAIFGLPPFWPQDLWWDPLFILPLLVATLGAYRRLGIDPVFPAWTTAVVVLSCTAGAVTLVTYPSGASQVASIALALAGLAGAALIGRFGPGRMARLSAVAIPFSVMVVSANGLSHVDIKDPDLLNWLGNAAWPSAIFAATAVAVAAGTLPDHKLPARSRGWMFAAAGLAGVPIFYVNSYGYLEWPAPYRVAIISVAAVAVATALVLLWQSGEAPEAVTEPRLRIAAIVLLAAACSGYGWISLWWSGFCGIVTLIAGFVLLPHGTTQRGLLLARVDRRSHLGHVLKLQQARTKAAVDRQYHQSSAAAIADEKLTITAYELASRHLRTESAKASAPHYTELALGTLTGNSPWSSGLAGLALGTVIGLPLMIATVVQTGESTWSVFEAGSVLALALVILHAARWSVYGLIYGYFYTRLRGRNAFAKATWFAVVMLPPELSMPLAVHSPSTVLAAVGVDAVQLFGFSAILALAWEVRQARRAGTGWDGVRDLRSVRALAAPASAIVLALITAVSTTIVNVEIPTLVGPQQQPQQSSTTPADLGGSGHG